MGGRFADIPESLKAEVKAALSDWVNSLSSGQAQTPVIHLLGASYTPVDILHEVEKESEFGRQYLEALFELHERMRSRRASASITSLIRNSIQFEREATTEQ